VFGTGSTESVAVAKRAPCRRLSLRRKKIDMTIASRSSWGMAGLCGWEQASALTL
jgi:hypothetical protein